MTANTLTSTEAAARLRLKPGTLRLWRMTGRGPTYVRLGGPRGRAIYREEDVEAFLQARRFNSTAEESERLAEAGR